MAYLRLLCFGLVVVLATNTDVAAADHDPQPGRAPRRWGRDDKRVAVLLCLSGLNSEYPDMFTMPNLIHLRSHGTQPGNFKPLYPGTAAPNLFSMATGVYPDIHGVLGPTVYDPLDDRIFSSRDEKIYTHNPDVVPLWTLNEKQGGVSACVMWPGCEVPFSGRLPTYSVAPNSSLTFTDVVDLIVSFATAKFSQENYRQFVLKDVSHTLDAEIYEPLESEVEAPKLAESKANSWSLHHLDPSTKHWYTSEREEKYAIVSIEKTRNNLDGIKQVIDSTDGGLQEDSVVGRALMGQLSDRSNDSIERPGPFDFHDASQFSSLSKDNVVFTLGPNARANFVIVRYDELQKTAEAFGPNSLEMKKALRKIDAGLLYFHLLAQQLDLQHKIDLILVSDHSSVPFGAPAYSLSKNFYEVHHSGTRINDASQNESNLQERGQGSLEIRGSDFVIDLSTVLKNENVFIIGESPVMQIWPREGADEERIFQNLEEASEENHFTVVRKHQLRPWHFSENSRIAKVLVEAMPRYAFLDKREARAMASLSCDKGQCPIFVAAGEAFNKGAEVATLETVDVYAVVSRLLQLTVPPNNSSSAAVEALFQVTTAKQENKAIFGFALFALVITIGLLLVFLRLYKRPNHQVFEPNFSRGVYRSTVESTINISPLRWTGTSDVIFVKPPDKNQDISTDPTTCYPAGLDERDSEWRVSPKYETGLGERGSDTRQSTRSSLDRSEIEQSETRLLLGKLQRSDEVSEI